MAPIRVGVGASLVGILPLQGAHALYPLYRCVDGSGYHFVSSAADCGIGTVESELGCVAGDGLQGGVAVYDCLNGKKDHFQSLSSDCEGASLQSTLGYVWLAETAHASRALYRCTTGVDHFVSLMSDCEGKTTEFRLGFVTATCAPGPTPSPTPAPVPTPTPHGKIVVENDEVGVEVDLAHGCSISGAWAVGDPQKTNIINTHDLGRYVQVSYYSGPAAFGGEGCTFRGQPWAWNPIGAGDKNGNAAQIISSSTSGSTVKCSMRPIQWACNNVLCDCTVDLEYRLDGNAVVAKATLNMERSDRTVYGARDQELPAVYTNGPFYRLLGYTGSSPCTGDANLEEWSAGFDNSLPFPWLPGRVPTITEPVLMLVGEDGFGLGVYSSKVEHFIAGFSGAKGSGGTKDAPTGYIAPVATKALGFDEVFEYSFALVVGNTPDIRRKACSLAARDNWKAGNTSTPAWV